MKIVEHADHAVVYPEGYLNGPMGQDLDAACADLIKKGSQHIIINFSHVETINTMGIAGLVAMLEKVGRRDGAVCFSNLLSANRQMLDVLDISSAVLIYEDEEEARRHLTHEAG